MKTLTPREQSIVARALRIMESAVDGTDVIDSPQSARTYLRLKIGAAEHEQFACLYLDNRNRVIAHEILFRGTLTQAAVYPREVVKAALAHNAAGVIFAHNHPSGIAEPSYADVTLTKTLRDALALVDVRTLDHFIVTRAAVCSLAERGQI